ncbi:TPA: helix-turn-helix transcriptional regulator [Vibrio alginolyticus]|uniref:helix-turn-helix transcriptional regulator n=1 Tax=Vibrio harveyi group TaxID=717610 RepID=UPI00062E45FE|nr:MULTISPECIES: AlpA family phage regulatory protein [Vibrio harveyi group]EGQ8447177.1 AlpA family phage regulatory protein [Vibrio alginolyticus]EGQ8983203.1 AlpA family phage regulatory protein [Vibrio alginolyticus]EJL6781873.1 AlpA family phage regulatory protein [Vibrio alginolyticus]EKM3678716.1 AlpA family phage regulatory protein [Vibrio alginolyticus]ELB2754603.1 AlpA family phage regulatory protein [Vibrio alginolyticus]
MAIYKNDRLVRESERRLITSISRSQAWKLEKQGLYPKRVKLGSRSIAWRLSELLDWVETRGVIHE